LQKLQEMDVKRIEIKVEDRYELWLKFLDIMSTLSKKPLTPKEKEVLAHILNSNAEHPLVGIQRLKIKQALNMKEQTLSMNRKNIVEKGWLVDGELHPMLKKMKEVMKEDTENSVINFHISICI